MDKLAKGAGCSVMLRNARLRHDNGVAWVGEAPEVRKRSKNKLAEGVQRHGVSTLCRSITFWLVWFESHMSGSGRSIAYAADMPPLPKGRG